MIVLGFLMAASICVEGHNYYNNRVSISIQTFYNELTPYGEWIYTPQYGYAWSPYLDYNEDFQPYATRGNWVYTDLGWTWVSEYRWGWATFHYGRWFFDDYFGWMWIPGYEWAPAWVTWGSYNDYWAWAPLGPNMNAGIYYSWHPPAFWWTFVPFRHFCAPNWRAFIYDRPVQVNNITYINNYYYGSDDRHNTWTWDYGPRVPDVERHTRTKVQKNTLVDADKPGAVNVQANQVKVYRPGVSKTTDEVRPANYRTVGQSKVNARTTDQNKVYARTTDQTKINTHATEQNRVNVQTTDQRKVNSHTEPVNQRKTETTPRQYGKTNVQPNASGQNTHGKVNTSVQTRQTEKTTPPAKTTTESRTNTAPKSTPKPSPHTAPPKAKNK